ncbi:MAG TPA: hypothetical protein VK892_19890 [Pyrinomonadaceae bacterium]|nr:hypothetical protein [Pyrinomonadaceae bacterium]
MYIQYADRKAGEVVRFLFGRELSETELANLVGAFDDSLMRVEARGEILFVQIFHPRLKIHHVFIAKTPEGRLFLRIDEIEILPGERRKALGAALFQRQVEQARKLNVTYIEAETDGNWKTFHLRSGYYVWARYGFNALLTAADKISLPPELRFIEERGKIRETADLNDIMLLGGQKWWKENGGARYTVFDPAENSKSRRVFEKYMLELKRRNRL